MLIGINDQKRFIADTPAVADEINANFDVFKTAHNDTDSRVTTIEGSLGAGLLSADGSVPVTSPLNYKKTAITNATNATPIVVTSAAHGRNTGDYVLISDILPVTQGANGFWTVEKVDADHFNLVNSVGKSAYTSGGYVTPAPKNLNDVVTKEYADTTPTVPLGPVSTSFSLTMGKVTTADITADVTISLPTSGIIAGVVHKCKVDFSVITGKAVTFPTGTGIIWKGQKPTSFFTTTTGNEVKARNKITYTTVDGGTNWQAEYDSFGGVETTWTQPILSANGIWEGASFAVKTSTGLSTAYWGFDNAQSAISYTSGISIYIWNPKAVKANNFNFTNRFDINGHAAAGVVIYGSNDDANYTLLTGFTNSNSTANYAWDVPIPLVNQAYYKYYKIYISSVIGNGDIQEIKMGGIYIAT